jgi:anti-sigma regulatory factor (Ser/Thr protein kinase)
VEFVITFAVEELFTNMVKYNPSGPPDVHVSADVRDGSIVVRLEDEQEHQFDPTQAPDPDVHKSISERRPGGLGLFLVRKMVDNVEYLRDGRKSIITLTHSVSHTDV